MSLKRDAIWTGLDTFLSSGLAFAFRLVVAKLLAPDQFGTMAMALTVHAVLQVIGGFGLTASLVQKEQSKFNDELVRSTFTISVAVSLLLLVLTLAAVAPLAALFYESAQVGEMIAVLSFCFLLTPFSSVATALLYRERRFRELATARAVSALGGMLVAGAILSFNRSAWVVVVQIVVTAVIMTLQIFRYAGWRPNLRRDYAAMRSIFNYSGLVLLNDISVAFARSLDVAVLARALSRADVGIYSLAFFLTDTARMNLMSILNRVMFVRYSQVQNDQRQLRENYLKTMRWNCFIIFPLMMVLILFGPALIARFYGPEWSGIDTVLPLLALSVMFHAAGGTSSTLYKAVGRPGLDLVLFIGTTLVFLLPGLVIGAHFGGLVGVAAAVAGAKLLTMVVRQIVLDRLIGSTFVHVARNAAVAAAMLAPIVAIWIAGRWLWPSESLVRDLAMPALALAGYAALLLPVEGRALFPAKVRSRA